MSREIKFRAWDLIRKRMVVEDLQMDYKNDKEFENPFDNAYDEQGRQIEDVIFMQFTGLKDKNGKEIYEGDIVSVEDKSWNDEKEDVEIIEIRKDIVELQPPRLWLKNEEFGYEGEELVIPSDCVVIGNIYENPGLLEEVRE